MTRVRLEKKDCILGIDPGMKGALACYCDDADLWVRDVPTFKDTRGNQIDLYQCVHCLNEAMKIYNITMAYIEQVHAMPKQGVSSMFKFGKVCGALEGIVASAGIPMTSVTPQKWKKELSVPKHKDAARQRASELMPNHAYLWKRVKDDGRAEASLIAYYGKLQLWG